ncbi:hypothetical protein ACHQM5_026586 [Ranunculus cassubicifolius]
MSSVDQNRVDEMDEGEANIEDWIAAVDGTDEFSPEAGLQSKADDTLKRNRGTTSEVWNHFERIKGSDPPRTQCKYCPVTFAADPSSNGTSSMNAHMKYRCLHSPVMCSFCLYMVFVY